MCIGLPNVIFYRFKENKTQIALIYLHLLELFPINLLVFPSWSVGILGVGSFWFRWNELE